MTDTNDEVKEKILYNAKLDWGMEDTVLPIDVNKWEQGILDNANKVDLMLKKDGSDDVGGALKYGATFNFTNDLQIPDLRTVKNQNFPSNCINSGAVDANGNPYVIASNVSSMTKAYPFATPNWGSDAGTNPKGGNFVIDSGYWQCFSIYQNYLLNGLRNYGGMTFPYPAYINKVIMGGTLGLNGYYTARAQIIYFYLNGVQVYSMYVDPLGQNGQTLAIPDVLCDRIYIDAGWGSSWSGDGGGSNCPGKQFTGYQMITTAIAVGENTPLSNQDLLVDFSDGTPNDRYGLHTPTIIGAPSFLNNKYNRVGTSGLQYPITSVGAGSWCMQGKFSFNTLGYTQILFRGGTQFTPCLALNANGYLGLWLSSNNTSWDIASGYSTLTKGDWIVGKEYYIRLRYDVALNKFFVDWSNDGTIWINEITVSTTAKQFVTLTNLKFGVDYDNLSTVLQGTMDELAVTIGQPVITPKTIYNVAQFDFKAPLTISDTEKTRTTLSTADDIDVRQAPAGGESQLFIGADGSIDVMPRTLQGKDFLFRFDNNDNPALDSYNNVNVTKIGNLKAHNGKGYFDGIYSSIRLNSFLWNGFQSAWTFETRVCSYLSGVVQNIFWLDNAMGFGLRLGTDNKLHIWLSSNNSAWNIVSEGVGSHVLTPYNEYHIAVVFDGLYYKMYVNGELDYSITSVAKIPHMYTNLTIGQLVDNSLPFRGYMDDIRLTCGIARYVTNFYPPVANMMDVDRFVYKQGNVDLNQNNLWKGCVLINTASQPNYQYKRVDTTPALCCVNSGNLNGNNYPDLIANTGKVLTTKVGGSYPDMVITDGAGTKSTINTASTLDASAYADGLYRVYSDASGNLSTIDVAQYQKDFYVDFSETYPADKYGLHSIGVVGSPTYTNGKFNSNGATGLFVPWSTMSYGTANLPWCIQGKFAFADKTSAMTIFETSTACCFNLNRTAGNLLNLNLSTGTTAWDIANVTGAKNDWAINTEYYIRVRFDGTKYYEDWSIDGNIWTNDITVVSSAIVQCWSGNLVFGMAEAQTGTSPLIGTMDELQFTVGNPTCIKRKHFFKQKAEPIYKIIGTVWMNTTVGQVSTKVWDGTAWQPFLLAPIGEFYLWLKLFNGSRTFKYYTVGYPVDNSSWSLYKKVPCGRLATNYAGVINQITQPTYNPRDVDKTAPMFSEAQPRTWTTTYTATESGWISLGMSNYNAGSYFFINGLQVGWNYQDGNTTSQSSNLIKISAGDTYWGTGAGNTIYFIPEKGLN